MKHFISMAAVAAFMLAPVMACEKPRKAKPAQTQTQNEKPGFHSTGSIICEGCSEFAKPGERFKSGLQYAINPSAVW